MQSIRTRLTTAFAAALIATLLVLAVSLYSVRRVAVTRELAEHLHAQADYAVRFIEIAREFGTVPLFVRSDTLAGGTTIEPRFAPLLELIPDVVMLKDGRGYTLIRSNAFAGLAVDQVARIDAIAVEMSQRGDSATERVAFGRREMLMTSRRVSQARSTSIDRIWVAVSVDDAELELRQLWSTIVVVSPFLIALSIVFAWVIAGRAFRPIDRIIDQVEAISDGRSLHRRLAIGAAGVELARLSATLNAMIGRLETSFGALRRFTADASHELKTPLAVMRADVERAMSPRAPSRDRAVALEEALQQVTRMADLVDSLLTLARADEGRFDLHREPIALAPLVREVVETARLLGEDADVGITAPTIADAEVSGDLTRLRQLFLNLVTNAIKYTPRGGKVEISLVTDDETAKFAVKDTGIGIAAADLPYVFERFWRADRVRSRASERGGFGLGLAISQWIAQAHGGTLTVTSKLTRGSTFVVTLPIGDGHDDAHGAEHMAEPPRAVIEP